MNQRFRFQYFPNLRVDVNHGRQQLKIICSNLGVRQGVQAMQVIHPDSYLPMNFLSAPDQYFASNIMEGVNWHKISSFNQALDCSTLQEARNILTETDVRNVFRTRVFVDTNDEYDMLDILHVYRNVDSKMQVCQRSMSMSNSEDIDRFRILLLRTNTFLTKLHNIESWMSRRCNDYGYDQNPINDTNMSDHEYDPDEYMQDITFMDTGDFDIDDNNDNYNIPYDHGYVSDDTTDDDDFID